MLSTNKKIVETNPQDVYIKDTKVSVKTVMEYEDTTPPPVNHPPVVDAGLDQTVKQKSTVVLDGSKSYDPDNDTISFQWTQKSGTQVQLINANQSKASFVAPEISQPPPTGETKLEPVSIVASSEDVGKEARLVNDENFETRWSADGDGEWLEFTFDKAYPISAVKLTGYHYDKAYYFEINGERFECPANRPENTLLEYDLTHLNINDSSIRLIGRGNNASTYNSYREVHFYTGSGGPPPTGSPVAVIKPDVIAGIEGSTITVSGSSSQNASKYSWFIIGDLAIIGAIDQPTAQLKIIGANDSTVTLTVTNSVGETNSVSKTVKVTNVPPPPPDGDVLWDSNIHLKTGKKYTITDTYGSQEPNGKGVWMAASGDPRLIVDEDGTFHLEADGGHGRVYIRATNFNARLEGELMFEKSTIDNTTLRLRSRHNEGGACSNRFGGFGATVERDAAEYQTESCHNEHENSISKKLAKPLEDGQWYGFRYSCCNSPDNKEVLFKTEYDYKDGKGFITVAEGKHSSPQSFYMDEPTFMKESYVWLRINNESTGSVAYRNVRIIKIKSISPVTTLKTIAKSLKNAISEKLSFALKVTDSKGLSNTDTVNVTVTADEPPPPPPVCAPGTHWDPIAGKCVPDVPPPPTGEKIIISHVGDTHGEMEPLQEIVTKVKPNFLIHSGDITDTESDDDNYISYTKELGLEYGKNFANSQGNHESPEESGEGAQRDMEAAFPILKQTKWMQTYQVGNVFIIIGNSQLSGYSQPDNEHMRFIEQSLAKAKQLRDSGQIDWVFYCQHKPYYTMKARHDSEYNFRYNVHPMFDLFGLDISLHGHNHDMQRSKPIMFGGPSNAPPIVNDRMKGDAHDLSQIPHGILNCINGSSTKNTSFSGEQDAWTVYANANANAYSVYTIEGKKLTGQYIEIGTGKVLHEFKATKA